MTTRQTVAYYNAEAAVYDENRYASPAGRRADSFHKRVLSELLLDDLLPGSDVIELGCGTGRLTAYAKAWATIFGVDISLNMLGVAKQRLSKASNSSVELAAAQLEMLPYNDNSFDAGYAILVMNLLPDIRLGLREVARVIKPGGSFIFNIPNLSSIYGLGGFYVNARGRTVTRNHVGHRYSHWYTYSQITSFLSEAGFAVEKSVGQPPLLRYVEQAVACKDTWCGRTISKSLYIRAKLIK